ncbi:MAG: biosynthetic arginine decarboxylase, partial [Salinisphaera sp.]|nr:biosynthetic arginine decarboxylase [Salinisphaera sp.]
AVSPNLALSPPVFCQWPAATLARAMEETANLYRALRELGAPLDHVDVGGGLAVDYEGRRATSFCSMDYGLDDYAELVVAALARVCSNHTLPQPGLVSESGRALTAHHAVLLTEVIDSETLDDVPAAAPAAADDGWERAYRDANNALAESQIAFTRGALSLVERAAAERGAYARLRALMASLNPQDAPQAQTLAALREKLADKYFCNFSVFQSVPDVWGLNQVFPVLPLQRLDERPDRRVRLCDLTCDSDGRMDRYVDDAGVDTSLPLHSLRAGERYRLGIFMVGAYQENLGDMHNLFGDTDAVNVELDPTNPGGWRLTEPEHGDRADELLRYVHFCPEALRAAYRSKVEAAALDADQRRACLELLEDGLAGYTYLLD